ncbi:MAG TPA: GlsB/YeaQ/YmgE family stress response membrane protein [Ktedonobacteraceae bacterium]|nr:GlsB/YeaQ/YmgE family stress response membrane protein [Ktedonobacteraceae bacterium]
MVTATLTLAAVLNPGGIIAWLVIGLLAGWLAGVIMPGPGFGLIGDMIVGLVGAFLGGLVMNLLAPDATFGFWGSLLVALIGACILVAILHAIAGRRTTPTV